MNVYNADSLWLVRFFLDFDLVLYAGPSLDVSICCTEVSEPLRGVVHGVGVEESLLVSTAATAGGAAGGGGGGGGGLTGLSDGLPSAEVEGCDAGLS